LKEAINGYVRSGKRQRPRVDFSSWGGGSAPFTSADQHSDVAAVTGAPAAGQKLVATDIIVSVDTDMTVTFKEETSGTVVIGPLYLAAKSTVQLTPRGKLWKLAMAGKKLMVQTSVAGNITVDVGYFSCAWLYNAGAGHNLVGLALLDVVKGFRCRVG
jgi:hypothetical protein